MRPQRNILSWLALLCLVGIAACGDGDGAERRVTGIALDPGSPKLAAGVTLDVTASYVSSDLTTMAAADVTWAVTDAKVAMITPGTGGHAKLRGVANGTTTLSVAGQGVSQTFAVTVTPAVVTAIDITPSVPSIAAGTSQQLTATGTFSDMTTMNLSATVTWSSSAMATATVDASGLLQGVAAGQAKITASMGTVVGMVDATVSPALLRAIQVTPIDKRLPVGITQPFTAIGVFTDDSTQDLTTQVTWSSDAEAHATISATGLVTAVAAGDATITASKGEVSGTSHLPVTPAALVSIAIDPPTPKVALGLTLQLAATGTFTDHSTADLTDQVAWVAVASTVATVSNRGLATSVSVGTTAITATKDGIGTSTRLEVTQAVVQSIHVTPVTPTIAAGTQQPFTATATLSDHTDSDVTTQVTWTSSDDHVATISNDDRTHGLATSKIKGTTTIRATLPQPAGDATGTATLTVSDRALVSIAVTPSDPTVPKGLEVDLTATGTFTDGFTQDLTGQVTWESSAPTVAEISNVQGSEGQARTLAAGETTIKATFVQDARNVVGTTRLTVTQAVLRSIEVTPSHPSLPIGHQLSFTATGDFTDGSRDITEQVTWEADGIVATISNADGSRGVATGSAAGTATITATFAEPAVSTSGFATLTVTDTVVDSIEIEPAATSLTKGLQLQYVAIAKLSDTTTRNVTAEVTWESSADGVAQISNADDKGTATALDLGVATITATFAQPSGNAQGTATLTVIAPVLVSITVNPLIGHVTVNGTTHFAADANFSDNTTVRGVQVAWRSRDTTVATIDATTGVATGVALGSTPIVATLGSLHADATLEVVTPPQLTSINPRDGQTDVSPHDSISLAFDQAMAPATFTTQIVTGPCSGALQLSQDDFATCIGFTSSLATLSFGDAIATATPAFPLDSSTGYRIRVLGSVTSAGGVPLGIDVAQRIPWFTRVSFCGFEPVISQVYGGGGGDGAPLRNAFIELHNRSSRAVNLGGFAVQYASADGADWQTQPLPSVAVAPGGYFLIQEATGASTSLPFPEADFVPDNPFVMDAAAGKVAITSVPAAMTDACPVGFIHVVDFVGYGAGVSCFEGGGGTGAPGNATSVQRALNGCIDHDNNGADFVVGAPAPRGTAIQSPSHICTCP